MLSPKDYLVLWFKNCLSDLHSQLSESPVTYQHSPISTFMHKHGTAVGPEITAPSFMQDFISLVNPKEFPPFEPICPGDPVSSQDKLVFLLMQIKGFFKRRGLISAEYFAYLRKNLEHSDTSWEILHLVFVACFMSNGNGINTSAQLIMRFFNESLNCNTDGPILQSTIWIINEGLRKFQPNIDNPNSSSIKGFEELTEIVIKSQFQEAPIHTVKSMPLLETAAPPETAEIGVETTNSPRISQFSSPTNEIQMPMTVAKENLNKIVKLKSKIKNLEQLITDYRQTQSDLEEKLKMFQKYVTLYEDSLCEIRELQEKLKSAENFKTEVEKLQCENFNLQETVKFYKNENNTLKNALSNASSPDKSHSPSNVTSSHINNETSSLSNYYIIKSPHSPASSSCENVEQKSPGNLEKQIMEKFFLIQTKTASVQTDQTGDIYKKISNWFYRVFKELHAQATILNKYKDKIEILKATCNKNSQEYKNILLDMRKMKENFTKLRNHKEKRKAKENPGNAINLWLNGIVFAATASLTYLACKYI